MGPCHSEDKDKRQRKQETNHKEEVNEPNESSNVENLLSLMFKKSKVITSMKEIDKNELHTKVIRANEK